MEVIIDVIVAETSPGALCATIASVVLFLF
jgi:hypothetical protein